MDIALCYPRVVPARGGCETYITDLARRLCRDRHTVHMYAATWDASALPAAIHYHRIDFSEMPRFLRPWRFAAACEEALKSRHHDVSIGFDKTWGQDILYPQGGVHSAAQWHNQQKYKNVFARAATTLGQWLDPACWSFAKLERKQYLSSKKPIIIANSNMVREHFERFLGLPKESIQVLHNAIDPNRFHAEDRPRRRLEERQRWGVQPNTTVGLFVAMNYRLKGLVPLMESLRLVKNRNHRIVVIGHRKYREFERMAVRLGVEKQIQFLGFRADPRDAYFGADYLVHPTFYDPCSLVVLEALACGLPVITTRWNGASELMSPRSGIVISDPQNQEELAAAIDRVQDYSFRSVASQEAREAAKKWTFDHHYQRWLEMLNQKARLYQAA